MIERYILLILVLSQSVNSKSIDDIFSLDADEVIFSETGEDFYSMRERLQKIPYNLNDTFSPLSNHSNTNETTTAKSTTEKVRLASVPPEIAAQFPNTTLRELKKQRIKLQLDRILASKRTLNDYLTDTDVTTLTRRADQIIEENKKNWIPRDTRRETYQEGEDWQLKKDIKRRYMNLMTHFVYITRYKLVFPQVLRKKYYDSPQYKIGFLFALLRHLKNMQKWIYWAMTTHGQYVDGTIYFSIKMYEKILRLDVDIKDAVLLVTKMQYQRNIQYNPKFYDYALETYD